MPRAMRWTCHSSLPRQSTRLAVSLPANPPDHTLLGLPYSEGPNLSPVPTIDATERCLRPTASAGPTTRLLRATRSAAPQSDLPLLRTAANASVDHHAHATSTGWKNRRVRLALSEFKPNASSPSMN